jgi:MFS family permease
MSAIPEWAGNFDVGELLGIGLDTRQIGYLAGALFLGLFGLSALRRVRQAGWPWPAVWIAVGLGLILGGVLVAARGFPDQVPDELRPWTDPDRLLRTGAVLSLLGCSLVFLSAYWLRNPLPRLTSRCIGLALAGTAAWLAAGWFGDQLPDEVRPRAARSVVTRALTVVGLLFLAGACWFSRTAETPPKRWANRIVAGPAAGAAIMFAVRWFGPTLWPGLPVEEVGRVTVILAGVGAGTCGLISVGAYLVRERPDRAPPLRSKKLQTTPLPVAVLLDDQGRPVLPAQAPHAGA